MNVVFFGDSLTESVASIAITDYLPPEWDVHNFGVSGTTIGEYSIYPVDGRSLLSLYSRNTWMLNADVIVLEYGINDVSSIMCGFTTLDKVVISFVKALDGIKQKIKNDTKIKFLSISDDYDTIYKYAKKQCSYLEKEYFKDYNFHFPDYMWAANYKKLISEISKRVEVIPMIKKSDVDFMDLFLGPDDLHPNEVGNEIIAENIKDLIF